jgi:hypothetical protein
MNCAARGGYSYGARTEGPEKTARRYRQRHRAKITTGEIEEVDNGKDPAAKSLGRKGGKARAASMTPERRSEIARKAAQVRWQQQK